MSNRNQSTQPNESRWWQRIDPTLVWIIVLALLLIIFLGIYLLIGDLTSSQWDLAKNILISLIMADLGGIFTLIFVFFNQIKSDLKKILTSTKREIVDQTDLKVADRINQVKGEILEKIEQEKEIPLNVMETNKLYLLNGLTGKNNKDPLFQNFKIDRNGKNMNAVYFLWADTYYKNTINASIEEIDIGGEILNLLRVEFDNKQNSFGCNIAIRPQDDLAIDNTAPKRQYLLFDARIPSDDLLEGNDNDMSEVAVALRVVNGYMQHWEYAKRPSQYIQLNINKDWKTLRIDLKDKVLWSLFDSDGNTNSSTISIGENPNFNTISFIILKFGKPTGGAGEPGGGKAIIDLKNIRLSDKAC